MRLQLDILDHVLHVREVQDHALHVKEFLVLVLKAGEGERAYILATLGWISFTSNLGSSLALAPGTGNFRFKV